MAYWSVFKQPSSKWSTKGPTWIWWGTEWGIWLAQKFIQTILETFSSGVFFSWMCQINSSDMCKHFSCPLNLYADAEVLTRIWCCPFFFFFFNETSVKKCRVYTGNADGCTSQHPRSRAAGCNSCAAETLEVFWSINGDNQRANSHLKKKTIRMFCVSQN